jgi:putative nucleotidyltransferase with HDIG domain
MIPSIEKCFHLMDKYQMLENIKAHSIVVAKVAHLIARGLLDAGLDISLEKTTAGALLHDIGKTASLNSDENHAEIGQQICLQNHLDEIADIVREHVILKNYNLSDNYSEKEIVYYSDKRVNHDKIVTLEERLNYILGRYGKNQERLHQLIKENFELCKKVEEKLFSKLDFSHESLAHLVKHEEIGITVTV